MAQSLPMGLARFLLAAQLAQSLPMGLCRAMRDCVLVFGTVGLALGVLGGSHKKVNNINMVVIYFLW